MSYYRSFCLLISEMDLRKIVCGDGSWIELAQDRVQRQVWVLAMQKVCGSGSSVGIATELQVGGSGIESRWGRDFHARPDRPWGPPSLLYNGYRVFPGGKVRPGRAADHSPTF